MLLYLYKSNCLLKRLLLESTSLSTCDNLRGGSKFCNKTQVIYSQTYCIPVKLSPVSQLCYTTVKLVMFCYIDLFSLFFSGSNHFTTPRSQWTMTMFVGVPQLPQTQSDSFDCTPHYPFAIFLGMGFTIVLFKINVAGSF